MIPFQLGSKDVTLIFLLTQLGASREVAVSAVVIERTIWMVFPLIVALVCMWALGLDFLAKDASLLEQIQEMDGEDDSVAAEFPACSDDE